MYRKVIFNVSRETRHNKQLIFVLFFCFLAIFPGCGEDSIPVDVSSFNKTIELRKDLKSAKEVMLEFYSSYHSEGGRDIKVTEENLTPGRFRVTLINDDLNDDSALAEKLVMVVKQDGTKWKVISIEKNWKCHKGRGHSGWGTEPCS